MIQKPHLSPTQLETFTRCAEAYRRRYIEGEIIPPGIALLKGGAFHSAAERNFRQKIETHADLKPADMREIAAAEFDEKLKSGYSLTQQEETEGGATVIGQAKDETVSMVGFHARHQAPDYQPVMVEEKVRIEIPWNSHDILGVIDLADDQDRVTDFKTAGRRKPQADADTSIQLTTYAAAFHQATGRPAARIALDVVVNGKKEIVRQVLTTERTDADVQVLANRIAAVSEAIKAGVFPPTSPGQWWCSSRWCGYAKTCRFYNMQRESIGE